MPMPSGIILSRVPFRISLGGGSTDLPSYYERFGGFIFAATVNLYMDVLIKATRSDDGIHVLYKTFEAVSSVDQVKHDLAREALRAAGVEKGVTISFKADTPAGTGLGSSGACSVALAKGLATFAGTDMENEEAAASAFRMTRALGLPDGVQDPYACALGGFAVLDIAKDGTVGVRRPDIASGTIDRFFANTLFLYTGVQRFSAPLLANQDEAKVMELKHRTKEIGVQILDAFQRDDLDRFGRLMDEHWQIKKAMSQRMSNPSFDRIYATARGAGALGGKIMGAGAGGYFMITCPDEITKDRVRQALASCTLREMPLSLDRQGARVQRIDI